MSAGDLSAIIARLEAATQKLESMSLGGAAPATAQAAPAAAPAASSASSSGGTHPSVTAFDDLISNDVDAFVAAADKIGGEVAEHAKLLKKAFMAQREFLDMASKSKKPSDSELQKTIAPTAEALTAVAGFRDLPANRRTKYRDHLATVCEGIPAMGWVLQTPKPGPYAKELADAAEFYGNRVIKDFKDSGEAAHVEWARMHKQMWTDVIAYIKQWHTTGVAWNPQGGDAYVPGAGAASAAAPAPAPPAGGPPPGPPPPPPKMTAEELARIAAQGQAAKPAANALFAEINKGEGITAHLKKVDKSQMTHKNPELRASSVVKAAEKPAAAAAAAPAAARGAAKKGPPVFELQGDKKWIIENQDNNKDLVITECSISQALYIYKCDNCVIKVDQKINAITLDSCKKTALVFDSAVASCEIVGCQSVQVQVVKSVPIINIDKTDGVQVFLPREAVGVTEFVAAKYSEFNVVIPGATDEDDIVETAVVEQFRTLYRNGKWVTEPMESMG